MKKSKFALLFLILCMLLVTLCGCGGGSSNYQLHNKDGSLNMKYVNDMNRYHEDACAEVIETQNEVNNILAKM